MGRRDPQDTADEPTRPLTTFLVFECSQPSGSGAPDSHFAAMAAAGHRIPARPLTLDGYVCIGAVNAEDEQQAAMAVMSVTRRISKFAMVPATIIDFQPGEDQQAQGNRIQLNP